MNAHDIIGMIVIVSLAVILLRNASGTSQVLNAISGGVSTDLSTLQGNNSTTGFSVNPLTGVL